MRLKGGGTATPVIDSPERYRAPYLGLLCAPRHAGAIV